MSTLAAGQRLPVGDAASFRRGEKKPAPATPVCESYGTAVNFVKTPREASRLADQQDKLVFLLHVSGNFEDDQFT
jgi:hypothetical protein